MIGESGEVGGVGESRGNTSNSGERPWFGITLVGFLLPFLVRAAKGNPASIGKWDERVPRPRIYRSTRAVSRGKSKGGRA